MGLTGAGSGPLAAAAAAPFGGGLTISLAACARLSASCTKRFISGFRLRAEGCGGRGGASLAISCFFFSKSVLGIPDELVCASNIKVHNSLANKADCSSPRNPTKSSWARFGSGDSASSGKNKLMAVDETISSSKPRIEVTFCSIH